MALLDFFKKKPIENKINSIDFNIPPQEKTLEEKNKEYLVARDLEVERLNAAYDFNTVEGIRNIPVPCREVNEDSVTGRVEYYLRGQCFAKHRDAGNIELAAECIKKAHDLMLISDMIWKYDSYMSSISWLHSVGKHEEARIEQARVDRHFSKETERVHNFVIGEARNSANRLDTDLVLVEDSGVCCSLCAKYRKRVYSLSGQDGRFPRFPDDFHIDCGLKPYPHVFGVNEPSFEYDDLIAYSNRPFVDDRTPEEVERHTNWRTSLNETAEKQARTKQSRQEFFWIQENLPELCPKSLSGYSRMKNANSRAYQIIVEEAAKKGKTL